ARSRRARADDHAADPPQDGVEPAHDRDDQRVQHGLEKPRQEVTAASAEWQPRATRDDLVFAACLLASFIACSWIVLHVDSPYGDLIRIHTDHLHHVRATWTFWKEGFDVYREPFKATAARAPYPFVERVPWPDFPVAYPPG